MSNEPDTAADTAAAPLQRLRLEELVDIRLLQRLQDWFAATTGISVALRDREGRHITRPSQRNRFCSIINAAEHGYEYCRASNVGAARQAAAEGRPVKYVCHAGLTQFAAPITIAGECVATLVLGDRPDRCFSPAELERMASSLHVAPGELREAADELVPWSDEKMAQSAEFLYGMARAITDISYQGYLLRARVRELTTLYETSRLLSSTLHLGRILSLMAKHVTEVLRMRGCSIRLLERRGKELTIQTYYNLSRRYINKGPVLVGRSEIDRQAMAGEIVHIRNMATDPRILYPQEAVEEGLKSGLVVGLFARGKPIGTLHLYATEEREFSQDELHLLQAIAYQAGVAIDNARLYKDSVAKQALDRELAVAGEIQEKLLPERAPEIPGLDIEGYSSPSHLVGGDFYDYIPIDDNHLAIVIADVAGKGVPAALLMATTRAALRAHATRTLRPSRVIDDLNRAMQQDTAIDHFVTLFYGVFNLRTRRLRYTNAGHNPPFRLRHGRPHFLRKGGIVLGIQPGARYAIGQTQLQPGDVLVLYTDGITESMNGEGEPFQDKRLIEVVKQNADHSPVEIIGAVRDAVRAFAGDSLLTDDRTMVVIKAV